MEKWESGATADVIEKAEALLQSKHRLEYNEDGSFRVLILADLHVKATSENAEKTSVMKQRIKMLVDKVQPNLVIMTGDNTIGSNSEEQLRTNISAIVEYIEEKQIPWCHVYGNHDHEGALNKMAQLEVYKSFEYCISKDEADVPGSGNYVHGVYDKNGRLGSLVWLLDSGDYIGGNYSNGYDYIKQGQIDWYAETTQLIAEYNDDTLVKGLMAFHIPLIENEEAHANRDNTELVYEYSGGRNEDMCPSSKDTTLLETVWELGDVKAIVTGHDHKNDYMYNYKGVKLASSPNITEFAYFDASFQGSRVLDLNKNTMDNVPTYVEYIIERVNPNDFEAFEGDILLEDFNANYSDPQASGYASNGLTGTVSFDQATDKGKGGSPALSVSRDDVSNFEFVVEFETKGKVGSNKYLVVWMDFTKVDFRKACVGLVSSEGVKSPYRTDDNDGTSPKFYFKADGSSTWSQLSHGDDGCFGRDQGASFLGKKGYFAFPIEDLQQGSNKMSEDSVVWGFYFYGSLWWGDAYLNKPIYFDNILLVEDYKTAELPTE